MSSGLIIFRLSLGESEFADVSASQSKETPNVV